MLLHDPSDIALEVAKVWDYLNMDQLATVFFALLLLSWLVLRLVLFPFWLIRSAMYVCFWRSAQLQQLAAFPHIPQAIDSGCCVR